MLIRRQAQDHTGGVLHVPFPAPRRSACLSAHFGNLSLFLLCSLVHGDQVFLIWHLTTIFAKRRRAAPSSGAAPAVILCQRIRPSPRQRYSTACWIGPYPLPRRTAVWSVPSPSPSGVAIVNVLWNLHPLRPCLLEGPLNLLIERSCFLS